VTNVFCQIVFNNLSTYCSLSKCSIQADNVERLGQKHHTHAEGMHQLPI